MGVLDFLYEGSAPPNVGVAGQTMTSLPRWLSDYTKNIISNANAVYQEPYQTYGGPRLAGLTPDQLRSHEMTRGLAENTPNPIAMATPYMNTAGQTFPGVVSQYMNPYMENVTNRAAQLTDRALREKLLPAVESKFGAAGHDVRSSAYRRAVDTGVRDLSEGLQAQNLAALASGYSDSANIFGQDASRSAQLAAMQGPLAQYAQQIGLTGAASLGAIGQEQQGDTQRSLDLAYQDFLQQRDYPKNQLDWAANIGSGVPTDRGGTTAGVAPLPGAEYGPTNLARIGSLVGLIGGLKNLQTPGNRRGGRVALRRGGALRYAFS